MLLLETGLAAETELVQTDPWNADAALLAANAAAKIPALSLDDGTHLVESTCIADYLIHRSGKASCRRFRMPMDRRGWKSSASVARRWTAPSAARSRTVSCRLSTCNAAGWMPCRGSSATGWALSGRAIEEECDLADLTVAVAFDYIDFRLSAVDWRADAPQLALSLAAFASRPSLASTRPA